MPDLGREWRTLRQLCRDRDLAAKHITEAWIAAAVRTLGSKRVTLGRGFTDLLGRTELTLLDPAKRPGVGFIAPTHAAAG